MAISTIHRLTTRLTRHPSLSLSSLIHIRTATTSAKVSDRIVKISAIDPDGQKREILGMSGQTLLKALTNSGMIDPDSHRLEDIDACSAECEVSIAEEWLQKLPKASYDEEYVLKRNSRNRRSKERDIRHDGLDLTKSPNEFGYARPGSHRLEDIDACSAECEVNIAKLSPVTYDEECVLKRNSRNRVLNKHSRLGCQVVLSQELQGMVVAVPEAKPWDIP